MREDGIIGCCLLDDIDLMDMNLSKLWEIVKDRKPGVLQSMWSQIVGRILALNNNNHFQPLPSSGSLLIQGVEISPFNVRHEDRSLVGGGKIPLASQSKITQNIKKKKKNKKYCHKFNEDFKIICTPPKKKNPQKLKKMGRVARQYFQPAGLFHYSKSRMIHT